MKKIAFVIAGLRGGGAEKVCVTLANGFAARGYKVDLVVLGLKGAVVDSCLSGEVKLVDLGVDHARKSPVAFWRYVSQESPEVLLSFNRQLSVVLVLLRFFLRLKFRLVSRNIIFLSVAEHNKKGLWHGKISTFLTKCFYPMSDLIIAQSQAMKEDLEQFLAVGKDKLLVIGNPVNVEIENYVLESTDTERGEKDYLLCVGRLEEQKSFHYAISAFATIAADRADLRLKIVGQGSLEAALKDQAHDLGVADRVDFEGFKKDIIPYYLGAKATLLTSLYEGFPNVLVESIALGTPVVAFDCPSGPSEIIVEGVNGCLVPYLDSDKLVKKIYEVMDKKWDSEKISATVSSFSSAKILDQYIGALSL